jgi:hypothetical protein
MTNIEITIADLSARAFSVIPCSDGIPQLKWKDPAIYTNGYVPLENSLNYDKRFTPNSTAIICGSASNYFYGLDFDLKNAHGEDIFSEFKDILQEVYPETAKKLFRTIVLTKTSGYHCYFYGTKKIPCTVFAYSPDEIVADKYKPIIEFVGEGHLITVPGLSPHKFIHGSFETMPTLSNADIENIGEIAAMFNEKPEPEVQEYKPTNPKYEKGDSLFAKFDSESDFLEILKAKGYDVIRVSGGNVYLGREGRKNKRKPDAVLYKSGTFVPYSASITEVPHLSRAYRPYQYECFTKYAGNFQAFADDLKPVRQPLQPNYTKPTPDIADDTRQRFNIPTKEELDFRKICAYCLNQLEEGTNIETEYFFGKLQEAFQNAPDEVLRTAVQTIVNEHGALAGKNLQDAFTKLNIWAKQRYYVRHNVVLETMDYIRKKDETITTFSDIYTKANLDKIKCTETNLKHILKSDDLKVKYNPIQEYFDNLQPKPNPSTIEQLCSYIKFASGVDKAWATEMIKKHLVRQVACALDENYQNRYMLVLVSRKQQIGKTKFIDFLHPIDRRYFKSNLKRDKDAYRSIAENFTVFFDEFEKFAEKHLDFIKDITSLRDAQDRIIYKESAQVWKRNASFYAATNKPFLSPDDENTRYLVLETLAFDWEGYMDTVSIHDIWFEAYTLWKDGYDFELNDSEKKQQFAAMEGWYLYKDSDHLISQYVVKSSEDVWNTPLALYNALNQFGLSPKKPMNVSDVERSLLRSGYNSRKERGKMREFNAEIEQSIRLGLTSSNVGQESDYGRDMF